MNVIKFTAERFNGNDGIKIRFAVRGNICSAGIEAEVKSAGFVLTEDVANCYYAWASTLEEAEKIQNAIKPMVASGKISV